MSEADPKIIHDVPTHITATAAPGQRVFGFPFRLFDRAYLNVTVNGVTAFYDPYGTTILTYALATDMATEGGTVTLGAAAVGGEEVLIWRSIPIERVTTFPHTGPVPMRDINAEFDRHIAIMQELEDAQGSWDDDLSDRVSKSGDTMTGPLAVPTLMPVYPGTSEIGTSGAPFGAIWVDEIHGGSFSGKAATAGHADTATHADTASYAAEAAAADRWTTAMGLTAQGDVEGITAFDGSADADFPLMLREDRVKVAETTSVGGFEWANKWPRLDPGGKISPSLVNMPDAVTYKGVINATTGAPAGTPAIGDLWINSTAGNAHADWGPPIAGTPLLPNDRLILNMNSQWERITGSSDISGTVARDGTRPPTAPMPWNNQDLTLVKELTATNVTASGIAKAPGITTNAAFVPGTSSSIQSANDVSIMGPAPGGMGYNFNLYWHNASNGYRAHHTGYSAGINFVSDVGGLNISHSLASNTAGTACATENLATFRYDGIWLNKWITGTGGTFSSEVQASLLRVNDGTTNELYMRNISGNGYINFDANDYIQYERAANRFNFFAGGVYSLGVLPTGIHSPVEFQTSSRFIISHGSYGGVAIERAGSSNTGYLSLWNVGGTQRRGYIGHMGDAWGSHINYVNENGAGHNFSGDILTNGTAKAQGFSVSGGNGGYEFWSRNNGGQQWLWYSNDNWARLWQAGSGEKVWFSQTAMLPNSYHSYSLGDGNYPYWAAHSQNWITVSDEREKDWLGGLNQRELAAARKIGEEIGVYRLLRERNGERDQQHVGLRAQVIKRILEDHELDPADYAFLHHHVWDARVDHDIDGNEVPVEAGDRYGLDYQQLALFLIAGQEQRLAALEARMT